MDRQRRLQPRDMAGLCVEYADMHGWAHHGNGWRSKGVGGRFRSTEPADWILESIAGMDFGGDARAARDAVVAWAKSRGVRPFHSRAEQLRWLLANRVKL